MNIMIKIIATMSASIDEINKIFEDETKRIVRRLYRYSNGKWYLRVENDEDVELRYNPELNKEKGGYWEMRVPINTGRGFYVKKWKKLYAPKVNGRVYMPPRPGRGHDETWWVYCS